MTGFSALTPQVDGGFQHTTIKLLNGPDFQSEEKISVDKNLEMTSKIVTLLTDFGLSDTYVAQMKGVIYELAPNCTVVDITHQIPAQNIYAGARALDEAALLFPKGTVHVAVVDPGVGTGRRIIAAQIQGHYFVLPDNGLLSFLTIRFPLDVVVEVTEKAFWRNPVSNTFHGRDIMAPVAAQIANGINILELGRAIPELQKVQEPTWGSVDGGYSGFVTGIDHFGNAITNLPGHLFQKFAPGQFVRTQIGTKELRWRWCATYGESTPDTAIALVGSQRYLEFAVNCGSAAKEFQLQVNDAVTVYL